jgi:ATP-binding cassette subfamily C (CFTR/MRP) protein 1
LDQGLIAELDTPLNLFDKEDSIFRGMCDAASLTREQIVKIRGGMDDDDDDAVVDEKSV